jgi:hypothetical protein
MTEASDRHEALAVYLNDHLAGSTGGLELAKRMAETYRDGELGTFLDQLVREVDEDRETLKQAMLRLGIEESTITQAMAWAGEKLARLKPNDSLLAPSLAKRLIELETMSLGVEGKLSLWRALERAGISAGLDLPKLVERATKQREGLERHRREAAATVLAVDPVAAGQRS